MTGVSAGIAPKMNILPIIISSASYELAVFVGVLGDEAYLVLWRQRKNLLEHIHRVIQQIFRYAMVD